MDQMNDKKTTTAVLHRFHPALDASPELRVRPSPTAAGNRLFLQQGEIDRACGVYCLAMALILVGALSRRQFNRHMLSNNAARASLENILFSGAHAADLQQLARRLCGERRFECVEGSHSVVLAGCTGAVENGLPVLLAVEDARKSYSHWILCVGLEYLPEVDEPSALLAIDPGSGRPAPVLQFYNWKLLFAMPRRGARYLRCHDARGTRRSVTCTEALIVH